MSYRWNNFYSSMFWANFRCDEHNLWVLFCVYLFFSSLAPRSSVPFVRKFLEFCSLWAWKGTSHKSHWIDEKGNLIAVEFVMIWLGVLKNCFRTKKTGIQLCITSSNSPHASKARKKLQEFHPLSTFLARVTFGCLSWQRTVLGKIFSSNVHIYHISKRTRQGSGKILQMLWILNAINDSMNSFGCCIVNLWDLNSTNSHLIE